MSLTSKTNWLYTQGKRVTNDELQRQVAIVAEYLVNNGSLIPIPPKGVVLAKECKKYRIGKGATTKNGWHERVASAYSYLVSTGAIEGGEITGKVAPPTISKGRPSNNELAARDVALSELKKYGFKNIHKASYFYLATTLNKNTGYPIKEPITNDNARRILVRIAKAIAGDHKFPDEPQDFYESDGWRRLRYQALKMHGQKCMCCGKTPNDGATLHVDHIKPRSKYPDLELDINNLQILCSECNLGKGAWDDTDYRS